MFSDVTARRFITRNREILRASCRESLEEPAKSDERDSLLRNNRPTWNIYRHAESSVSLFAATANLSGPIPTSRGKKTFDKRLDIPVVRSLDSRGFLYLAKSDPRKRRMDLGESSTPSSLTMAALILISGPYQLTSSPTTDRNEQRFSV